jgi:LAGLIDADG DNA endonuclease family
MEKVKLIGKNLDNYKEGLVISKIQREIIIGTLLGDASMELRNGKPVYSVKFEQGFARVDYINHLHSIFFDWTGMGSAKVRLIHSKDKFKKRSSIWFRTYRHKSFKFYYGIFYTLISDKKIKIVPKLIHRFLTPRALAYWFMDDGTYHRDKAGNIQYYLSTQSFNVSEQKLLVEALRRKFSIIFNIHKDRDKYRLYLKSEFNDRFTEIVKTYIIPSMTYKLKGYI